MPAIEAEKLLRIALFSDTLRLQVSTPDNVPMHGAGLVERRQRLAQSLREQRRRGVVPVFFSFMWFSFALAMSIVSTFARVSTSRRFEGRSNSLMQRTNSKQRSVN